MTTKVLYSLKFSSSMCCSFSVCASNMRGKLQFLYIVLSQYLSKNSKLV